MELGRRKNLHLRISITRMARKKFSLRQNMTMLTSYDPYPANFHWNSLQSWRHTVVNNSFLQAIYLWVINHVKMVNRGCKHDVRNVTRIRRILAFAWAIIAPRTWQMELLIKIDRLGGLELKSLGCNVVCNELHKMPRLRTSEGC